MTDHYSTLGVAADAPQEEIKRAYRKLAMEFHPDKNPGDAAAEERFKQISAAYTEVGEPEARARYDQQRQYGNQGGPQPGPGGFNFNFGFAGGDMEDIISQFFAQNGFGNPRQARNRDFNFNLLLTLEEAFTGKQTPVQFSNGGQNHNIIVNIPPGIDTGARMRYQGHGDRSVPNAPPGDLYIQIQIQEHPVFKRSGPHLHTELEIDAIEAMLGCTKELICIDGQTVSITVPEGAQPDTTLRLRERGMPMRHSGTPRGDCLVGLKIKVPTDLSDEHKAILRDIANKRTA